MSSLTPRSIGNIRGNKSVHGNYSNSSTKDNKSRSFINYTLNGLQQTSIDADQEITLWAGQRVLSTKAGGFNKKKDNVTQWENIYYKGGLFKHIE